MPNTSYRSEWKYRCTDGQLSALRARLEPILTPDEHGRGGAYPVRSLYFDDWTDVCSRDNEAGTDIRVKYRVRRYQSGELRLERKEKRFGRCRKQGCAITPEQFAHLYAGDVTELLWSTEKPLLKSFCVLMMTRVFTPKLIIDYERTAFVEPISNVRITFDRNICAALPVSAEGFLSGSYLRTPMDAPAHQLLEVKFDAILPGHIASVVSSCGFSQETYSKYYYGRLKAKALVS